MVAAAAAGPVELIEAGRTGVLVPTEDAAALAAALGAVLEDPGLATGSPRRRGREYEPVHAEAPVLARWRAVLSQLAER